MRPLIGITINEQPAQKRRKQPTPFPFDFIKKQYFQLVESCGGLVVLIPCSQDHKGAAEIVAGLHGLFLTGGVDVHPRYYHQRRLDKTGRVGPCRDRLEIELVRRAMRRKLPIFAICRGIQILNVALGGSLYQDLSLFPGQTLRHHMKGQADYRLYHTVEIERDSLLGRILGRLRLKVNSSHHQVLNRLGRELKPVARAADGVIEGVEGRGDSFVLGVQWHPEAMPQRQSTKRLFGAFVDAAGKYARCRQRSNC